MERRVIILAGALVLACVVTASAFDCHVCRDCLSSYNTTIDVITTVSNCVRCQKTMEDEDSELCDRLCVTSETIQHFDILGVDHSDGCRNISLLPGVSPNELICFCSSQLCNDVTRITVPLATSIMALLVLLLQKVIR